MQNGRIYTKALFNDGNPQERLPRSARNDEYHQSPRRVQAPLVLARNVSDTAISPAPVLARNVSDTAISPAPVLARNVSDTAISPAPVLARNVSDTAISPAPRPCEERQRHGNLTRPPSLRGTSATRQSHPPPVIARSVATWQSYPQKKGLLHPFGVRNDGSIQESRDINRSNRNSHSFLDIIVSLKKMNLFLLSQR
ncbi:hypothetical protein BGX14_0223 [Fibrobacter sp. UWS1]|nr:hypothetical protein BGX14_0223 [Fibrobacter sp. UWS1]